MNKIVLITITLLFPIVIFSQSPEYKKIDNNNETVIKINKAAAATNTIKSKFTQEKFLSILDDKLISSGDFYFARPNSLRWEYKVPFSYLILMHKGKIILKDENKTNRFDSDSNEMFRQMNEMIISLVQGSLLKSNQFTFEVFESSKDILIKLTPNIEQMRQMLPCIDMYFNRTDYSVTEVKMHEDSGDYTLIRFQQKQLNSVINNTIFNE